MPRRRAITPTSLSLAEVPVSLQRWKMERVERHKELAHALKAWRKAAGYTQWQVDGFMAALEVPISRGTVARLESPKEMAEADTINFDTLWPLMVLYGQPLSELERVLNRPSIAYTEMEREYQALQAEARGIAATYQGLAPESRRALAAVASALSESAGRTVDAEPSPAAALGASLSAVNEMEEEMGASERQHKTGAHTATGS